MPIWWYFLLVRQNKKAHPFYGRDHRYYRSVNTHHMDKMMEQHINYMNSPVTEMIDFFETRGNILEFKQEEKKYSASLKDKWSKKNKS